MTDRIGRRQVLAGGAAVAGGALFAPSLARAASGIKIGYVTPQTGPLAGFGEADAFTITGMREALKKGVTIGGKSYPVTIIVKDSQSNPNRAATVAGELITGDAVDLMVVASTPETTNPVSDQCELNGVPCISTMAPWQPWFFTRGGDPKTGFEWTYHFFWGLEDIIATFNDMWNQVPSDHVVGGLFPNDGDGNAWGDAKLGFPPVLAKNGYKMVDPGRYQNLSSDFTAQINAFKGAKVDILTGVVIPPDFTTFWTQAKQQGLKLKCASIGKALLFPASVEALGETGNNLSSEIWWSPNHPFKSSLTGASAAQLAQAYTTATKRQWTQPIGFGHALFEVAVDALTRSGAPNDKAAVIKAIAATKLNTIVGPVDWSKGPVKNVAKTPLAGGQWRRTPNGPFKYELVITSNVAAPNVPTASKMEPLA
jgi:branched-chain amino acid transport system substrate-binding protein